MDSRACLVVLMVVIVCVSGEESKSVSFIFGDSLSDVGNNNYFSKALAKANYPWYGIDFGNGMPTGRFTNGRTISDIVADKLGLPVPAAYMDPTTTEEVAMKQGVNYASGGGGILNETGWHFIQRLSLYRQIEMFMGTKTLLAQKYGEEQTENFTRDSVFLVAIGSNDYINNYLLPITADSWKYGANDFADYLIATLRRQLTILHSLGARKLLFFGLGPLGCIPLQRIQTQDGSCKSDLNDMAVYFNKGGSKLIDDLNSQLPEAKFQFGDGFDFFTKLIQNPQQYGFNNSDAPCCTVGRIRPTLTCLAAAKLCKDRSKYVFWDEYHPSDAANVVIAENLLPTLSFGHTISPAPSPAPSAS
ncbi:hypothetical protein SUGI_0501570 [Cryptomeria japonica]|uniref:GDSL esterase/lipase At1g74460 n=1 Tax=Cryptomeria japonica TaxID=3369 RepID=UPI002408AD2D|nr:GDSL esterase/lipase At1g74460 [Cryptomeria japonica]GLJ26158.1 hypothetical protein SUGI_0501570 [Cryptomeria japonica]